MQDYSWSILNMLVKVTCRSRQPVMKDAVNEMLFPHVAIKNLAFIHQSVRRLTTKPREVWKLPDWVVYWSYRSEVWQASGKWCCWSACVISERLEKFKPDLETSRDLAVRRPFGKWMKKPGTVSKYWNDPPWFDELSYQHRNFLIKIAPSQDRLIFKIRIPTLINGFLIMNKSPAVSQI